MLAGCNVLRKTGKTGAVADLRQSIAKYLDINITAPGRASDCENSEKENMAGESGEELQGPPPKRHRHVSALARMSSRGFRLLQCRVSLAEWVHRTTDLSLTHAIPIPAVHLPPFIMLDQHVISFYTIISSLDIIHRSTVTIEFVTFALNSLANENLGVPYMRPPLILT